MTSIVDATIGGSSEGVFQYTNPGSTVAWQEFTFDFTASAASTTLGFFNGDTIGSLNGLDNVTVTDLGVTSTPLPAALPLFASGLGAMGLFGWRRKRKIAASLAAA